MPPTYATADQARAYMARVLARRRPCPEAGPPRVYLIVYPPLRANARRWARLEPGLRRVMRGAELVGYRDVFGRSEPHPEVTERIPAIAAACAAALVVPYAHRAPGRPVRYLLGYPARLEAEGLAELGVPVLVLTPAGLAAWPDVRVRPADPVSFASLTLELDMPELPAEPLPTVAASFRALGLRPPARRPVPAPARPGPPSDHPEVTP